MREVIISRAAIRHGRIRAERFSGQFSGILKELYQDDIKSLVFSENKLLAEICR